MDFGTIIDAAFSQAFGPQAIVFALAAIGLNVHFGYTGLLNFGQAGFMSIAAFGLAVTVVTWDLPFLVGILVGLLAAVVLALILGVPTLRLRADYLAIATIATSEILRLIFGAVEFKGTFGGSNGLTGFVKPYQDLNPYGDGIKLGVVSFSRNDLWSITVGWTLVAIACLIVWALMRSPWGRVLKSIREDEDAVRSLGKNVFAYKMQALVLGGVFGGIAGIFHILKQGSAVPTDFNTTFTFYAYAALLIGGAARVLGPVVGSMLFWFLIAGIGAFFSEATKGPDPVIPSWIMEPDQASLIRLILLGLGLMLLMIFRPQGIFGDRREIAIDGR
ncbi:branched-chain amino acid ABC transporter permease [Aeromicrobium chenweiae]|uniref:Branched-chain amino acid ABC transporter permease n=1 Tax=Aeromicrobium chenweiae TaxID=2079793 RepID=A0A2S0WL57_9ACTN|nr:branched-chain amino acid ABC transporter permease [Aeromicrobium chenweiae]AWB92037.1 branched-chain amino acid ABC transporter permease [Aeromicrobium chenweiae]TGN32887.1 branched-chain amino acid ABC transporter permease [Aeromicrobium chenweiae]